MDVLLQLQGLEALVPHNERTGDPLDPFARAISAISGKRKKSEADYWDMAKLEFLAGLYTDPVDPRPGFRERPAARYPGHEHHPVLAGRSHPDEARSRRGSWYPSHGGVRSAGLRRPEVSDRPLGRSRDVQPAEGCRRQRPEGDADPSDLPGVGCVPAYRGGRDDLGPPRPRGVLGERGTVRGSCRSSTVLRPVRGDVDDRSSSRSRPTPHPTRASPLPSSSSAPTPTGSRSVTRPKARRCAAWLGMARLPEARSGLARRCGCWARPGKARLPSPRSGRVRRGWARRGWARPD